MVIMIDQIYDRDYRAARTELNRAASRGIGHLGSAIRDVFEVLVGIEYASPWTARSKQVRSH